jgi:hypothetical protein
MSGQAKTVYIPNTMTSIMVRAVNDTVEMEVVINCKKSGTISMDLCQASALGRALIDYGKHSDGVGK